MDDDADPETDEYAYYVTLGHAYLVALEKNVCGEKRTWWDEDGRKQTIPQRSPHTNEGLGDVAREYYRIIQADRCRHLPLLDDVAAKVIDPLEAVISKERTRDLMKYLTAGDKQALEREISGESVRDEADKRARTRARGKLRQLLEFR